MSLAQATLCEVARTAATKATIIAQQKAPLKRRTANWQRIGARMVISKLLSKSVWQQKIGPIKMGSLLQPLARNDKQDYELRRIVAVRIGRRIIGTVRVGGQAAFTLPA